MKFLQYAGKRLIYLLPVLFGISLMAFLLGIFSPGDPARMALSQGVNEPTEEEILAKRAELGLDRPIPVQYLSWMGNAFKGDLGTSYLTKKPVLDELTRRAPVTIRVALFSVTVLILLSIPIGIVMAIRPKGILHRCLSTFSIGIISVPGFCISLILIFVFSERLRILPTSGVESFRSYIMPSVALALPSSGSVARLMESSLRKELARPYITAAYSKGFAPFYVTCMHALRNSLIPVVTMIGNHLGAILGGAAIVEGIFSIPGLGSFALTSIYGRDYPCLQGYVLITGCVFVLVHYAVDMLSYALDPQLQLEDRP